MPILTDLCDKSCLARKFQKLAWIGKRDATVCCNMGGAGKRCVSHRSAGCNLFNQD